MSSFPRGIPLARRIAASPTLADGELRELRLDGNGAVFVTGIGSGLLIAGTATPADDFTNPTNAVTTWALTGALDSGGRWDRLRAGFGGIPASFEGFLNVLPSRQYALVPATLADGQTRLARASVLGATMTAAEVGPEQPADVVSGTITIAGAAGPTVIIGAVAGRRIYLDTVSLTPDLTTGGDVTIDDGAGLVLAVYRVDAVDYPVLQQWPKGGLRAGLAQSVRVTTSAAMVGSVRVNVGGWVGDR